MCCEIHAGRLCSGGLSGLLACICWQCSYIQMNSWPVFSGILITQVTAKEESLRVPGLPQQETLRLGISLLLQVGGLLNPGWTLGERHVGLIF